MNGTQDVATVTQARLETTASRLRELVAHLRQHRTQLREEWARRITEAQAADRDDRGGNLRRSHVRLRQLRRGARDGDLRSAPGLRAQPVRAHHPARRRDDEVVGIVLLLRDVLARSLFAKYQADFDKLNRILDAYEPAANRIANTVAVGFVQERERIIRQQQEAIRELSTPVLQVRERLLILPIIGVIDPQRARQLTEQLLRGIRDQPRQGRRASTSPAWPPWTRNVANHLVQTVEASRLLGATVIVTGLSPKSPRRWSPSAWT